MSDDVENCRASQQMVKGFGYIYIYIYTEREREREVLCPQYFYNS